MFINEFDFVEKKYFFFVNVKVEKHIYYVK